jgi:hypothetical protein
MANTVGVGLRCYTALGTILPAGIATSWLTKASKEPIRMRGLIKAQKILTRLGAKPNVLDPFPEKPPRMHWRTYQRLHRVYEIAKDRSIRGVLGKRPSLP